MSMRKQRGGWKVLMVVAWVSLAGAVSGRAHCEIPCGIYGDRMRVDMLEEHAQTIEKSMRQIKQLQARSPVDWNQIVRWIVNKEDHANEIQEIVYQYFMNQRVTPVAKADTDAYEKYVTRITLLHQMLVQAMKCKQTTDEGHVSKFRGLLDAFEKSYFEEPAAHDHKHD